MSPTKPVPTKRAPVPTPTNTASLTNVFETTSIVSPGDTGVRFIKLSFHMIKCDRAIEADVAAMSVDAMDGAQQVDDRIKQLKTESGILFLGIALPSSVDRVSKFVLFYPDEEKKATTDLLVEYWERDLYGEEYALRVLRQYVPILKDARLEVMGKR
jgi:hypothetical protein